MKKFLIIEDDKSMRALYSVLLKRYFKNPAISFFYNGDEALKEILNSDYDLIISDINMEVMDGITFHRKLKKREPLLANRVIFMSSCTTGPHIRYIKSESLPFLHKPFRIGDFYSILSSTFELHRQNNNVLNTRKYKRFNSSNPCIIETLLENKSPCNHKIEAEFLNYSSGGMGIRYSGEKLADGEYIRVFAEAIKISEKEARIVWTSGIGERTYRAGLQWI